MGKSALKDEKKIGRFIVRLFKDDPQCDGDSWISFSHRIDGGGNTRLFTHTYGTSAEAQKAFDLVCQTASDVIACIVQDLKETP